MKLRELRMNLFPTKLTLLHQLTRSLSLSIIWVFFFAHEESIWASLPNLVHFIIPHNSHETCALQLLKLGGSSRLLDFISYSLSLFSLNKALSRQYCITMKAQNGYVWSDRRSLSRYSRFMKHLGRFISARHAGSLVYSNTSRAYPNPTILPAFLGGRQKLIYGQTINIFHNTSHFNLP